MRKLTCFVLCLTLTVLLSTHSFAANNPISELDSEAVTDLALSSDFLRSADLSVTTTGDGSTLFTLSRIEPVTLAVAQPFGINNNLGQLYSAESLQIIAFDDAAASEVLTQLHSAIKDIHLPESNHFGASLHMYINVFFYHKPTSFPMVGTFYKLSHVEGYATVRNGTYMVSEELLISQTGTTDYGKGVSNTRSHNVLGSNPFVKYAPNIWDYYVTPGSGGNVGSTLICTVARPGGAQKAFHHTVLLPQTLN